MRYPGALLLLITCCLLPKLSHSQESVNCPRKVALLASETLTATTSETLKQIYKELGCHSEFIEVPGRRGIRSFNKHLVDGEFFRLKIAEKAYKREFVRSTTPLFTLYNSIWFHPDPVIREKYPQGYLLGIVWHEEYMKDRQGIAFHDAKSMFQTYSNGRLSGFLSSRQTVQAMVKSGKLSPTPIMEHVIISAPLYHYLGAEYASFMTQFSELIRVKDPFSFVGELRE